MFVHLRLHSEFSVVDGTCRIDDAIKIAAHNHQPALALTDFNNLFGAIKFYKEARNRGVKPLIGAEITLENFSQTTQTPNNRLILLVQNHQGYLNLCELIARIHTQSLLQNLSSSAAQTSAKTSAASDVFCSRAWLKELNEGLIALSGAQSGSIGQALLRGDWDSATGAIEQAKELASIFNQRFYLEIQRAGRKDDEAHVKASIQLALDLQLPLVATHPIQFTHKDDFEAHEARVCIAEGEILGNPKRVRHFTHEQYFKSSEEMKALFADLPSAIENTVEIAKRCNLTLTLGKPRLPDYPTPNQMSIEDYFRLASFDGLKERLIQLFPDENKRKQEQNRYEERLEFEIKTILNMGFPGYFLIVSDFINWAKQNDCPVGPGRGSGAGSLVAYALKITDLDPLQYNLLFERFLNPERVSMPDFDIDFCQANRDRVIDYVKEKYGKNAVSQIATFGTMAARAAIRDVGRVLDFSYGFCDGISKLIPNKPGMSVTLQYPPNPKKEGDKNNYAIELEPQLKERLHKEEDVKTLIELAQKLEGLTRNIGMHAGGVLIAPGKLTDFCPLYQQLGSESAVSQYDKDDVEAIGLVKFDFLGLATLTILEIARKLIVSRYPDQQNFAFESVALDDLPTYQLFQNGQTEAVFQFESAGMQRMLKDAKPTRLEDLIALNALYRPGPMDLIPSFIARKHGREKVEYPHPLVGSVLSETYGIMVYQEQVMQTAQVLGGYSLGGADLLRRAMGKKKADEMAEHRALFREGASKKGISQEKADEVFDLMEKFAGYGFNKSHAAAYSLLAYHTAWLKVHYTAEFFCANMTVEMDDTDKLKILFEDAQNMGLRFEPPDVNQGNYRFEPIDNQTIRYGLGALKGSGQQAIEAIVAARKQSGAFKSLFDFCCRVERSRINKRTVESLIKAGAFDSIHENRAELLASVDVAFEFAIKSAANIHQGGLFDMMGDDAAGSSTQEPEWVQVPTWGIKEQLTHEKTAIGFYFSGHLFDEVAKEVRQFTQRSLADVSESKEAILLAGIVSDLRTINTPRGKLAIFKLDDQTRSLEATADENLINAHKNLLKDDELIIISAKCQNDRFSGGLRLNIQKIWDLSQARCRFANYLLLDLTTSYQDLNQKNTHQKDIESIKKILTQFPAKTEITEHGEIDHGILIRLKLICEENQNKNNIENKKENKLCVRAEIQLGEAFRFYPSDEALKAFGDHAQIIYLS